MSQNKVSIIGAGNVGATATYYIAEKVIADLVMVDIEGGMTRAKALDFLHAGPLRGYDVAIVGSNDFAQIAGSNVVVVTAGLPRKPGMDRMDLLKVNAGIVKQAARAIAAGSRIASSIPFAASAIDSETASAGILPDSVCAPAAHALL